MTVEENKTLIDALTVTVLANEETIENLELRLGEIEVILSKRFSFNVTDYVDEELSPSE